ncbi:MAG: type II toxin-antitoxin system HicB family antitoxin [Dehalococcoidia bacterium]|nr:MAG: type II toxin-antitoxin system HicB family antitoxin [Dehalococcoidia bacterium]
MLTEYIQAAIDSINWKVMDDGSFYAEIPLLGLHINNAHLEECQCRIREMLEEHIVVSLSRHSTLPAIGGVEIVAKESV